MSRPPASPAKRQGTTSADIFERLVEAILSGRFPSGSPLREAQLAREWKVSRTPMREAVRRAAEAGFLVLRPNQAPIIRPLTATDIHNLYEVRELLELHALKLAWPRITPSAVASLAEQAELATPEKSPQWVRRCLKFDLALHRLWMDACANSWLRQDLDRLYQFLRIVQNWMSVDPVAMNDAYREHVAILEALQHHDQTAATRALRFHIRRARDAVCATINEQKGFQ